MTKTKMRLILKNKYPDLYKKFKRNSRSFALSKEIINTLYTTESIEEFRNLIKLNN